MGCLKETFGQRSLSRGGVQPQPGSVPIETNMKDTEE